MTLYADTVTGVHTDGDETYVTQTLTQDDFYSSLATLLPTDYIKADCDSHMVKKLEREYGIRGVSR